jgi:hypothetical protein
MSNILVDARIAGFGAMAKAAGMITPGMYERMTDGRVSHLDLSIANDIAEGKFSSEASKAIGRALAKAIEEKIGEQGFVKTFGEDIVEFFPYLNDAL